MKRWQKDFLQKDVVYDFCDIRLGSLLDLCSNSHQSHGIDFVLPYKAHDHLLKVDNKSNWLLLVQLYFEKNVIFLLNSPPFLGTQTKRAQTTKTVFNNYPIIGNSLISIFLIPTIRKLLIGFFLERTV